MKLTKIIAYLFSTVLLLLLALSYGGTQTTKPVLAYAGTLNTTTVETPPTPGFDSGPHVNKPREGSCPPDEPAKIPPDVAASYVITNSTPPNQTVSWTNYYLGSWTFVEGDRDLRVTQWCMGEVNKATGGVFYFFSLEISTSVHLSNTWTETLQVAPTEHCCPYNGGRNKDSGLPGTTDKEAYMKIPPRVDWISRNPHLTGQRDNAPNQDGQKIIYWVVDGKIVKGKITKRNDRVHLTTTTLKAISWLAGVSPSRPKI